MNIRKPIKRKKLCVGDVEHNELCKQLIDASKYISRTSQNKIFHSIERYCSKMDFQWIHMLLTKTEISKLCALIKSKTEATLLKRTNSLIMYEQRSPYALILNSHKVIIIENISKILSQEFKTER